MLEASFWQDKSRSKKILKEKKLFEDLTNSFKNSEKNLADFKELYKLAIEESNNDLLFELSNNLKQLKSEIKKTNGSEDLKKFSSILENKIVILESFAKWLEKRFKEQKDDVSASFNDFLKTLGYIALGYSWLKMSKISILNADKNKNFYEEKINTAKYFFDKITPRIDSHYHSAISGSDSIMKAKFN